MDLAEYGYMTIENQGFASLLYTPPYVLVDSTQTAWTLLGLH
jgi:hypothetical protein